MLTGEYLDNFIRNKKQQRALLGTRNRSFWLLKQTKRKITELFLCFYERNKPFIRIKTSSKEHIIREERKFAIVQFQGINAD